MSLFFPLSIQNTDEHAFSREIFYEDTVPDHIEFIGHSAPKSWVQVDCLVDSIYGWH
jgi:hypothetical protein